MVERQSHDGPRLFVVLKCRRSCGELFEMICQQPPNGNLSVVWGKPGVQAVEIFLEPGVRRSTGKIQISQDLFDRRFFIRRQRTRNAIVRASHCASKTRCCSAAWSSFGNWSNLSVSRTTATGFEKTHPS